MFAKRTNWNLQPNRLSEALAAHPAAGKPLLDLTISNPTECGFQYDDTAILRALQNPSALKYEPNPKGLEIARAAIQEYYTERLAPNPILAHKAVKQEPRSKQAPHVRERPHSKEEPGSQLERRVEGEPHIQEEARNRTASVAIDDIFLTTSTSEAYSYVFRALCDPGDEVLIPEPSYPLFQFLADIQDVQLVRYPLVYDHGWQIDFHSLEQALTPRTRAVIVVNPNNPTGNYCKAHEMLELNELCASRKIAIIADEVFLDFSLKNVSPGSFAANRNALTFTLSGLSKICGLPQMKAAWVVVSGPEPLKAEAKARLELIADTYLSMNAPVQWALPKLLSLRHGFQKQLLGRVRANLAELDRQLARQNAVNRLTVEGGWNTVLRVPATQSDEEFSLKLLSDQGVYVHPGHFYDFPADGYLVLSLITPEGTFADGVQKLLHLI